MSATPPLTISSVDGGFIATGEIDAHTAPTLAAAIDGYAGDQLSLDLSGVEFVDSSGLRVLIESHQRLQDGGRQLRIVSPSPTVQRLFQISGVDTYLTIE
jgi:anti-sigma B factor antagonist